MEDEQVVDEYLKRLSNIVASTSTYLYLKLKENEIPEEVNMQVTKYVAGILAKHILSSSQETTTVELDLENILKNAVNLPGQ